MKIYTKTGDNGTTALIGGTRVSKNSPRVEAYGTVDELISWIGVIRSYQSELSNVQATMLRRCQECLMTCAALLATDENTSKKIAAISDDDIRLLETSIDEMQATLTPLNAFVLPSAPTIAAMCHVARSACRRAERCAVTVLSKSTIEQNVLTYLNRLSDYLFTLSRQLTANIGIVDDCWLPSE